MNVHVKRQLQSSRNWQSITNKYIWQFFVKGNFVCSWLLWITSNSTIILSPETLPSILRLLSKHDNVTSITADFSESNIVELLRWYLIRWQKEISQYSSLKYYQNKNRKNWSYNPHSKIFKISWSWPIPKDWL